MILKTMPCTPIIEFRIGVITIFMAQPMLAF